MKFPLRTASICSIALAFVGTAYAPDADAQVYKYRDPATGKIIMTDNPPSGAARQRTTPPRETSAAEGAEATDGATAKQASGTDPRLEARAREEEAKEKAEREAADAKFEEKKRQYCSDLERNIATLESGQRIAQMNAAGEREFMTDEKRSAEISRLRAEQANCP